MSPSARTVGVLLGAGRAVLGSTFLVSPVFAVRILGLDSATAHRVTWLSRMTAGRDLALAAGALVAEARGRSGASWVAAGAAADAVDAAAILAAVRAGKLGGPRPVGMVGGAFAAAAVGFWAAARR
ncbi:MAG: hypothetical protein QOG80_1326 [Pseudonocardiales bacterium]|jgi:hypothetical protein|nr:hypothetical protein [Pseudonocardiales bacterium]